MEVVNLVLRNHQNELYFLQSVFHGSLYGMDVSSVSHGLRAIHDDVYVFKAHGDHDDQH